MTTMVQSLQSVAKVCRYVVTGLSELHSRNIVHGDIKISNLVENKQGRVEIYGFPTSGSVNHLGIESLISDGWEEHRIQLRDYWQTAQKKRLDKYYHWSPEFRALISWTPCTYRVSLKTEFWSVGTLAASLILEAPGYPSHILQNVKNKLSSVNDPKKEFFISFLTSCLQSDPEKRPNAHDLLNHPFLQN